MAFAGDADGLAAILPRLLDASQITRLESALRTQLPAIGIETDTDALVEYIVHATPGRSRSDVLEELGPFFDASVDLDAFVQWLFGEFHRITCLSTPISSSAPPYSSCSSIHPVSLDESSPPAEPSPLIEPVMPQLSSDQLALLQDRIIASSHHDSDVVGFAVSVLSAGRSKSSLIADLEPFCPPDEDVAAFANQLFDAALAIAREPSAQVIDASVAEHEIDAASAPVQVDDTATISPHIMPELDSAQLTALEQHMTASFLYDSEVIAYALSIAAGHPKNSIIADLEPFFPPDDDLPLFIDRLFGAALAIACGSTLPVESSLPLSDESQIMASSAPIPVTMPTLTSDQLALLEERIVALLQPDPDIVAYILSIAAGHTKASLIVDLGPFYPADEDLPTFVDRLFDEAIAIANGSACLHITEPASTAASANFDLESTSQIVFVDCATPLPLALPSANVIGHSVIAPTQTRTSDAIIRVPSIADSAQSANGDTDILVNTVARFVTS